MTAAIDGSDTSINLRALAVSAGIVAEYAVPYGRNATKTGLRALESSQYVSGGGVSSPHYAVVTAIIPTSLGEGKTTMATESAQGLNHLGQQAVLTLCQPAMDPTFGIRDGAGGSSGVRILPAERTSLHLTGGFHTITAAHSLLLAMIDNHLYYGNELGIDERTITWSRVSDVNGRTLHYIVSGLGVKIGGATRQASFDIAPASELMVITSLTTDPSDLRRYLGRIAIGRSRGGERISTRNLKAAGAMCAALCDALEPNLLRTDGGTPVLVHADPFGNIATGYSPAIADRVAVAGVRGGGCALTEAGLRSDMDLGRFVNPRCTVSGIHPSVAVVVVTIRVFKAHSGRHRLAGGKNLPEEMLQENVDDVYDGATNLFKHLQVVRGFGITPVVVVNALLIDHDAETEEVTHVVGGVGARVAVCHPVTRRGEGYFDLAGVVVGTCREAGEPASSRPTYEPQDDLRTRISKPADLHDADGVDYTPATSKLPETYEQGGFGHLPVIVAKTPLFLSAEPNRKGVPIGRRPLVYEVRLVAGAGYVYTICGNLPTMPGPLSRPAAEHISANLDTRQIVELR